MAEIIKIAQAFLIALGFGVGVFNNFAPAKLTGAGFQKLVNSVCLGATFIAAIIHASYGDATNLEAIAYYVGAISFLLIRQLHADDKSPFMWMLYALHNIAGLVAVHQFSAGNLTHFAFILSSALYLGVITYAMVLGHYYLVVPKLTVDPLKLSLKWMWAIFAVKLVWSSYGTYLSTDYLAEGTMLGGGYAFNWLMILMRYIWGYVIIFTMSVFTWKLVCLRSTQSATGVLYAMTIFVFIGELISGYLFFKFGMLV